MIAGEGKRPVEEQAVRIPLDGAGVFGDLSVPRGAKGLVLFAHGSGSSRFSPRNRFVARRLQERGLATLLLDLLTAQEEQEDAGTGRYRFDVTLLADRLLRAVAWTANHDDLRGLRVGLFGASTGAAAALRAAAADPEGVAAVVSRGGRPDLAREVLLLVRAPTLLIVGGADEPVLQLNREAFRLLTCEKRLEVVPGAGHLFEEPGALERVADLAADWFARYLASS
ncbi:MAG: dienelactone hydrolase family protein [Armatimonadota bacterium]|nr:dienelactone hydrolase family protein [Armatimonadota bacterium]MDR7393306.1 dienelactone hydrolase family protein [Armatimonadota bacterium]MDR7397127.1 dienelactone hydrolase family protein [Armatimonadota bacterium]MDR7398359.1 dienelactone hydrolase family protein [Armatimonadota bacterium]MDR7409000.1 dienelactone hydrolase family protein [Armatimonadota bacterium]